MDHQCFSSMHPCWISTPLVILKLIQRYFTPFPVTYPSQIKGQYEKQELGPIRSLAINLLTLIINEYVECEGVGLTTFNRYYTSLKPTERICCIAFTRLLDTKKEQLPLINSIKRGVCNLNLPHAHLLKKRKLHSGIVPPPFSLITLNGPPPNEIISRQLDDMFDLQPLEVAKRLCVLEFEIFKNVQVYSLPHYKRLTLRRQSSIKKLGQKDQKTQKTLGA